MRNAYGCDETSCTQVEEDLREKQLWAECGAQEGKGLRRGGEVSAQAVVISCVDLRQSEPVPQGDHPTIEDREIREGGVIWEACLERVC